MTIHGFHTVFNKKSNKLANGRFKWQKKQKQARYRFCLRHNRSSIYYHLHRHLQVRRWRPTSVNHLADFNKKNFNFNLAAIEQLHFKHLLTRLAACYGCFVMPLTYCINHQNWAKVMDAISSYYGEGHQETDQTDGSAWIMKPVFLDGGQEIKIFPEWNQLRHYLHRDSIQGEYLLQKYITSPHLVAGSSDASVLKKS